MTWGSNSQQASRQRQKLHEMRGLPKGLKRPGKKSECLPQQKLEEIIRTQQTCLPWMQAGILGAWQYRYSSHNGAQRGAESLAPRKLQAYPRRTLKWYYIESFPSPKQAGRFCTRSEVSESTNLCRSKGISFSLLRVFLPYLRYCVSSRHSPQNTPNLIGSRTHNNLCEQAREAIFTWYNVDWMPYLVVLRDLGAV